MGLILLVTCATTVSAQEKKSWWSFSSGSDSATVSNSAKSSSMFSLPTWAKPKPKSKWEPSMSSKIKKTSKTWWNNTVDFLNPFNDANDSEPVSDGRWAPPKFEGKAPQF
jgi:hypothetical protein